MVWEVQVGVIFLRFWGVCFKIVFWSSWGLCWGRFGGHFGIKIWSKSKKNKIDFGIDFRCLAWKKLLTIPGPGRLWGTPHMRARFQQEKMKRLDFNNCSYHCSRKKLNCSYHCSDYCWLLLIIVQIIVEFCLSQAHARDLTRPGQGLANYNQFT